LAPPTSASSQLDGIQRRMDPRLESGRSPEIAVGARDHERLIT